MAALLAVPMAQAAAQLPPAMSGMFRPTLNLSFAELPKWRSGSDAPPRAARALDDPGFSLAAGLVGGFQPWSDRTHAEARNASPGWSALPHEAEAYPNGDAMRLLGISPFSVADGALRITASPMPAAAAATLPAGLPGRFLAGALNTFPYGQTYGYFEVEARIPHGRGLWPAFWLLPVDGSWPPEIDAPEVLGHDTSTAYFSLHTTDRAWLKAQPGSYNASTTTETARPGEDLSLGYHRYGVDWERGTVSFYLDGARIGSRPTPADMHAPFYLIVNLAVGDRQSWPGPIDAATTFPASMAVRSIRVWQKAAP